ncbi:MAG: MFS transporter [Thermomicrobiales bacterium]|nr:MFS transporter [Thermomicrobiales bacterium]
MNESIPANTTFEDISEQASENSGVYRNITIGMVALVALFAYQALAVTTAMPNVAKALDGMSLFAVAFAAPLAMGVIGMVGAGIWCDQKGPAGPLWSGIVLFVAAMVIVGLAPTMGIVVLGRAVNGLGSGLVFVALYVVIGRAFPEASRPAVFVALSAAWVVPSIVGPTIAGLTVEKLDWRWVFLTMPLVVAPAAYLVRPAMRLLRHESAAHSSWDRRNGLIQIGWAIVAAFAALGLHWGGERRDAVGIGAIVVALAALAVSAPKLLPAGTFRAHRGLPTVFILRGMIGSAFFAAEIYLPLLLQRERELSPAMAGSILTIGGVAWFGGSWLRKRLHDSVTPAQFIGAGAISLFVGILAVSALVWETIPVLAGIAGWGFSGFGMGLIYSSLSLQTLNLSPAAEQGTNSSALQVTEALTVSAVLALTGTIFISLETRSASAGYLFCFAVAGVLALATAVLSPRVQPEAD